jgi:SAM-dependent methyltransferase
MSLPALPAPELPSDREQLLDVAAGCHERIQGHLRRTLADAILAGHALNAAKEQTAHGDWLPLLARRGIPDRSAALYMQLARHADHPQIRNVANLPTLPSVRKALAAARDHEREELRRDRAKRYRPCDDPPELHCCRFQDLQVADNSVDLVVVDPPWDRGHVKLFGQAARVAARILRPGGLALVYPSHHALPRILADVGRHLTWVWPLSIHYPGNFSRQVLRRIKARNHLLLLWSKGPPRPHPAGRLWFYDSYQVKEQEFKDGHAWQQSFTALAYFVHRLTEPGDVVVDLTVGGGTTAAVCRAIGGRKFVGCDCDALAIQATRNRVAGIKPGSSRDRAD